MKRNLFFITLLLISFVLNAQQWIQQNTNMTGATPVGVEQISIVDSNIVWVVGFNGAATYPKIKAFARTNNGGVTWSAGTFTGFGASVYPFVLTAVSYDKAFCVAMDTIGNEASFWKTVDGGSTWTIVTGIMNDGTNTFADGVKFWDNGKGFCFGDPVNNVFDIYTTSDSGTTWTKVNGANISAPLSGEYGYNGADCASIVAGGIGFFLTNQGRVYKTTDYGATWAITPTPPFASAASGKIYASSANYVIMANLATSSSSAFSWRYTNDGGSTWLDYTPAGPFYESSMCYVPGTPNTFVASSGSLTGIKGVAFSIDGGLNWTDYSDPLLHYGGDNIQCLAVNFYNASIGWVGNFDTTNTINSILKYYNPSATYGLYTYVKGNDFNIYPNPCNGQVIFAMNGISKEDVNIKVFDVTGNMVFKKILNGNGISNISYDFSNLPKGIYIVNISSGSESFNKKLVIN